MKKDIILSISIVFLIFCAYNVGLKHNPRIELKQALRNTPAVNAGVKGSEYNFFGCDVKELDYENKEVILNKCTFKYISDNDQELIKAICEDGVCDINTPTPEES